MTNQSPHWCRLYSNTSSSHQATIWSLCTKPDLHSSFTTDLDESVTMSTLCQLMGGLVTIANIKEGGNAGCEPAALSQICSLRSTHTAAHTVHCCTLPHTMHTAAHNVHNTQHVQVAPTTTNGLLHASNAYSNKSNRREVSMHLDRPIRWEGFARRSHIWWFAGIAVDWHGGSGSSHTHQRAAHQTRRLAPKRR